MPGTADPRHAAFWRALPGAPTPDSRVALDERIAAQLESSKARCASFGLPPERLLTHWARLLGSAAGLEARIERANVDDLALALACADGVSEARDALKAMIRRVLPAVRRIDPSTAFVDEVEQRLLERLLVPSEGRPARIAAFAGESSLTHWLRAVAVRLALNLRRDSGRVPEVPMGDALVELAAPFHDPRLESLQHGYGPAFSEALREAILRLGARARSILRLHYVESLGLAQIGRVYQVNKSTVSRWLADARSELLERLRDDLGGRLGVAGTELDSLIRSMRSRVELSLSSVLRSQAE